MTILFLRMVSGYVKPSKAELVELQNAAHRMRIDSLESTTGQDWNFWQNICPYKSHIRDMTLVCNFFDNFNRKKRLDQDIHPPVPLQPISFRCSSKKPWNTMLKTRVMRLTTDLYWAKDTLLPSFTPLGKKSVSLPSLWLTFGNLPLTSRDTHQSHSRLLMSPPVRSDKDSQMLPVWPGSEKISIRFGSNWKISLLNRSFIDL